MLPLLTTLSPNAAVLYLTLGLVLIAVEVNRPGLILPGAIGLLLALLAAASLASRHPSTQAVLWTAFFVVVLVIPTHNWKVGWLLDAGMTAGLIISIRELLPHGSGPTVNTWSAISSGLLLGVGTTVLTRIARRARENKGLD
jgi:membrane-bound ClpP family serine protease